MPRFTITEGVDIPLATDVEHGLMSAEDKALLDSGLGGGGLPEGTTLDEIPDGATRAAVSPADLPKLAAYVADDGKTGDLHATETGNPHGATAEDVGAASAADFDALVIEVGAAATVIDDHEARVDALETTASGHTSDIGDLDTRLDNLEGDAEQWVYGPFTVLNAQIFANMPAAVTAWTSGVVRKVSLWKASKLFFWSKIVTADTNTGAAVRHQYTTDLVNDTGWTDFSGADISLATTAGSGRASSIIDVPSGAKTQEFVLIRCCGVNGGANQSPSISFPAIAILLDAIGAPGSGGSGVDSFNGRSGAVNPATDDYSYDQIAETATGKKFTATLKTKLDGIESGAEVNDVTSVHGRTGAVVAASGDYATAQVTESTDKKFVTDAEKARLANVPSDTTAELAAKATTAALTAGLADKADAAATTAALNAKAPLASPALTGTPTAPTPAAGNNSTLLATTAFVKNQGYLASVPSHAHAISDVTGLSATLDDLDTRIEQLTVGGTETSAVLSVTSTASVDIPNVDVIFVEHTVNANLAIPGTLAKKPHVLVLLGNPNTVNFKPKTGSGQTIDGAPAAGFTYVSGTKAAAVSRILFPDPDVTNFPNRWRIF